MISTLAPFGALFLSIAMLLMGNGLQGVLLVVRAGIEGFTSLEIGLLGSGYYVGFLLGCLLGPYFIARVRHIRAFTAMVSIASTTVLVHALITVPWVWWSLRLITGFCFAAVFMVIESWLNASSSNHNRGLVFGVYSTINLVVITAGQLMLTLDDPAMFSLFAVTSLLVSLAAVPVALTRSPEPDPPETLRIRLLYLYRSSPVGFAGAFASGLVNGAFWALGPLFAQRHAQDTTSVAIFMSIAVMAGALGQWPIGRVSDTRDRRVPIIVVCLVSAAAALGVAAASVYWPIGVYYLIAVYGFFAFALYALCVAHVNDFVEVDGFVEAAGGLLLMFGIGAVIGPALGSLAMQTFGRGGLFLVIAAILLALGGFALVRMHRRAPVPEEERGEFATALATTVTVSNVDLVGDEDDVPEVQEEPAA